jgi:hypothetical protein
VADGVNAAVDAVKATGRGAHPYRRRAQAEGSEVGKRYDAVLSPGELRDSSVHGGFDGFRQRC